ncbi:hypothetical protein MKX50_22470 [Paenibacillus sp. FSL W8-0186]|uniref:PglD-related sugar-binding protein n=1 Tax=Paenibacillus sp. FSL W8-0186 TaxID=2921709 RepID=UPI0030CFEBF0
MSKVIIYGSQQFAHYVKEIVLECGHHFIGYIDDYNQGDYVLGSFDEVMKNYSAVEYKIVIAIGYNNLAARWKVYNRVVNEGYEVISLIHPGAYVHKTAKVGRGTIISVGSIIDYNVVIGEATFIWPSVTVNHDCRIGSNCYLSPQVNICGFVEVGDNCFLGASSVIINGNNVKENSFIKAGTIYHRKESKNE